MFKRMLAMVLVLVLIAGLFPVSTRAEAPQTTVDNSEVTVEGSDFTANGSYYIVTVENMVVADARQDITCTVYDGETVVATATDSVESYTARKSDTLFDLLMRFSDSAYNYFHN